MPPGNEYAAEQLKSQGNTHFKNGDYESAEMLYSQAIQKNSKNPLLFTNRANARLKLEKWEGVIDDCIRSIDLMKENMKAFFYLGKISMSRRYGGFAFWCTANGMDARQRKLS